LIWRRTVQARLVKRYDAVPMFNHGGITPPQHRPDYCAQKKNGRPENKRSLRNQTNLTQGILNELLKHQAMLPDKAEPTGAANYLSRAQCPLGAATHVR
jgi:hypothetical protein